MSLIADIKKLQELEQKAQDAPDWPSPVEEVVYTDALLQHAPAMFSVLACFRDGDAERLERASERLRIESIGWREDDRLDAKEDIDAYRRLQKAASLMEEQ